MKLPTADIENLTNLSSATEHNEQNQRELMINIDFDFDIQTVILISNQFSYCVILILIWNHYQNDLSQHWHGAWG